MKPLLVTGVILIILGALSLGIPALRYTEREEVLKLGPIEAVAERERSVPIPPVVGWVLLAGGLGLVGFGAMRGKG